MSCSTADGTSLGPKKSDAGESRSGLTGDFLGLPRGGSCAAFSRPGAIWSAGALLLFHLLPWKLSLLVLWTPGPEMWSRVAGDSTARTELRLVCETPNSSMPGTSAVAGDARGGDSIVSSDVTAEFVHDFTKVLITFNMRKSALLLLSLSEAVLTPASGESGS